MSPTISLIVESMLPTRVASQPPETTIAQSPPREPLSPQRTSPRSPSKPVLSSPRDNSNSRPSSRAGPREENLSLGRVATPGSSKALLAPQQDISGVFDRSLGLGNPEDMFQTQDLIADSFNLEFDAVDEKAEQPFSFIDFPSDTDSENANDVNTAIVYHDGNNVVNNSYIDRSLMSQDYGDGTINYDFNGLNAAYNNMVRLPSDDFGHQGQMNTQMSIIVNKPQYQPQVDYGTHPNQVERSQLYHGLEGSDCQLQAQHQAPYGLQSRSHPSDHPAENQYPDPYQLAYGNQQHPLPYFVPVSQQPLIQTGYTPIIRDPEAPTNVEYASQLYGQREVDPSYYNPALTRTSSLPARQEEGTLFVSPREKCRRSIKEDDLTNISWKRLRGHTTQELVNVSDSKRKRSEVEDSPPTKRVKQYEEPSPSPVHTRPRKRGGSRRESDDSDQERSRTSSSDSSIPAPPSPAKAGQLPMKFAGQDHVRTNGATLGQTTRTARNNKHGGSSHYKTRALPWGDGWQTSRYKFEYRRREYLGTNMDCLKDPVMSADKISEFITHYPDDSLRLWIQRVPADCQRRYPDKPYDQCRFEDCPGRVNANIPTIEVGHMRVAFDAKHKRYGVNRVDPFDCVMYAHLYCVERFLDLPFLIKHFDVQVENREKMPSEPDGVPKFAWGKKYNAERTIIKRFIKKVRADALHTTPEWCNYPVHDNTGRPKNFESTLLYHVMDTSARNRTDSQKQQFYQRKITLGNFVVHKGDKEIQHLDKTIEKSDDFKQWKRENPGKRKAEFDHEAYYPAHVAKLLEDIREEGARFLAEYEAAKVEKGKGKKAKSKNVTQPNSTAKKGTRSQKKHSGNDSDEDEEDEGEDVYPDDEDEDELEAPYLPQQTTLSTRRSPRNKSPVNYSEEAYGTYEPQQHHQPVLAHSQPKIQQSQYYEQPLDVHIQYPPAPPLQHPYYCAAEPQYESQPYMPMDQQSPQFEPAPSGYQHAQPGYQPEANQYVTYNAYEQPQERRESASGLFDPTPQVNIDDYAVPPPGQPRRASLETELNTYLKKQCLERRKSRTLSLGPVVSILRSPRLPGTPPSACKASFNLQPVSSSKEYNVNDPPAVLRVDSPVSECSSTIEVKPPTWLATPDYKPVSRRVVRLKEEALNDSVHSPVLSPDSQTRRSKRLAEKVSSPTAAEAKSPATRQTRRYK